MINKAVELNIKEKLIKMLEKFRKKEIDPIISQKGEGIANKENDIGDDEINYANDHTGQKRKISKMNINNPIVNRQKG